MTKSLEKLRYDLGVSTAMIEVALNENTNLAESQLVALHADLLQAVGIIQDMYDMHSYMKKYEVIK